MMIRAVRIERAGGPEEMRVVALDLPDPGPGEVRIRHHAIGVNFTDVYRRTGLYGGPLPAVLGVEGAGVVEAVGPGVTRVAVGARVAYAARSSGSYAEARNLEAELCVSLPDAIDFEQAAAVMLKGLTVQFLLRRTRVQLRPGDPIVWHAAAGGVGLIACQWGRALGLTVIGTAGSAEKCALAVAHGAAHGIDYRREDVVARVRELTGGAGVEVVYDSVGKDTWERSLDCLRPLGLLVSFGNASGPVPPFAPLVLSQKGSLYLTRPTLFTHLALPGALDEMAAELFGVVARGDVQVEIGQRFALDRAADAHRALEGRRTTGATILVP